jgi:DNA-binding transcriptional ArsR family regulator
MTLEVGGLGHLWGALSPRARAKDRYTTMQLCYCLRMSTTTTVPHPLPGALVELIAERFRVLSEPMRIRLLDALRDGPSTVQGLERASGGLQQNVSKHLGVLLRSGMVSRSKEGNFSLYSIADESVFALCEHVCGGLRRQLDELDSVVPGGDDA